MLIKMFQVKGYDAFRGLFTPENFTHENLSEKVRGQHGIKLLLEVEDSFFLPGIVGVICIGTQVTSMCFNFAVHRSAKLMRDPFLDFMKYVVNIDINRFP